MRYAIVPVFLMFVAFSSGCSINKIAADRTAAILNEGAAAFYEEDDLKLAEEAMPASLKTMEALLKASPDNDALLTMLAQGYCSYAFGFLEDSGRKGDLDRAKVFYRRGYGFALRAMPVGLRKVSSGNLEEFEKVVAGIEKDKVGPLFWGAYCLGSWVNLNKNDVAAVADLPRVEMMMRQVLAEDEGYYHGGAHLFYGVYYGSRPKMLGGNPTKAKEHFEKAVQLSDGKFLLPKMFLAQFYAVPVQDQKLFHETLQSIIDAPADLMPSEKLANQIAKKRAAHLLTTEKDLF